MHYGIADRMVPLTGSAIREIFKLLANPDIISFAGGVPNPDTFANEQIAEIAKELLLDNGKVMLQYGITEGYMPFRETAKELLSARGIDCKLEQVIATSGATQGIDTASKALLNEGDAILVESPTFLGALQIFNSYAAKIVPVEMDEEGVILEDVEEKMRRYSPKLFYIIPTFQNPTGRTLSLERRKKLVELAEKYGVLILEDDPYGELRYAGNPLPSIKSFDENDVVIHLMSCSKTVSPGLRVGAAVAAQPVIAKMTIAKQCADTHSSNLSQAIVDLYVRRGLLKENLPRAVKSYAVQMQAMLEALEAYFPKAAEFTRPEGGLFIWATLPEGVDGLALLREAVTENVAFIPGTHFYDGGGHDNTLRLNFSACDPERIKQGIKTLGAVIARHV
ncbi:MAG: PLP-dependent aminotransferase family protein [Bacillota bacterium]